MLHRINQSDTPPGGWRYRVEATGKEFSGVNYSKQGLAAAVSDYLTANGMRVPEDLEAQIEDQTCKAINGDGCEEQDGLVEFGRQAKLTLKVLLGGTKLIGSWLSNGLPRVNSDLADARSAVCASCMHNVHPSGCKPCQSAVVHSLIGSLIGKARSLHHDKLQACDRCGCSLAVKVWVPIEHLKTVPPVYELPEWCWLKKEIENAG